MAAPRWIALESNPEVLNKYIGNLGVSKKWQFVDILGLDQDLLAMVPRPVAAVMLLYPNTEKAKEKDLGTVDPSFPSSMYYMKQTIGNACGTVALVHALANNDGKIPFAADKYFREFLDKTKSLSPKDKAVFLEKDEKMESAHDESAQEGDTEALSRDVAIKRHFICFVNSNGRLYEMDGRKEAPVFHKETSEDSFLEDTMKVVKEFMDREPDEINFTLLALAKV